MTDLPNFKGEVLEENKEMVNAPKEDAEEEEGSDVGSETGTYTIDKETPEVVTARLSIDANFGIDPSVSNSMKVTFCNSVFIIECLQHY